MAVAAAATDHRRMHTTPTGRGMYLHENRKCSAGISGWMGMDDGPMHDVVQRQAETREKHIPGHPFAYPFACGSLRRGKRPHPTATVQGGRVTILKKRRSSELMHAGMCWKVSVAAQLLSQKTGNGWLDVAFIAGQSCNVHLTATVLFLSTHRWILHIRVP